MANQTFVNVEEDSRYRCQAVVDQGQCPYRTMPDSQYCKLHYRPGIAGGSKDEKMSIAGYRLAQWNARVLEMENSSGVKSLRSEIGILRMTLESTLVKCQSDDELLLYAPRLSDLATKIERLVVSCQKVEQQSGMVLDKAATLSLAGRIITIIGNRITDADLLGSIADDIAKEMLGELK